MPSLEQHCEADLEKAKLSRSYPEVHGLLDQFAHYPDYNFLELHRRYLHHHEGIEYVRMRFGEEAERAAKQHVIDDCGHIPHVWEYYDGSVDNFGGRLISESDKKFYRHKDYK